MTISHKLKPAVCVVFALLAALALLGCDRRSVEAKDAGEDDRLRVVSTVFPGFDFARAVAGDTIGLAMLLPPGSESHSFEPSPKDIITIQSCDVFIFTGGESDTWVKGILESMDTSNMTVIPMMNLVEVVEEEIVEGMEEIVEENGEDSGHNAAGEETEYDEHVWTSPVNAIRIIREISDVLCGLDESNAGLYRERAAAYIDALEELDTAFRETAEKAGRKVMVFGDRFPLRYFADEYGLDYYAAFPGCSAETEPSARTVAFLIDKVRVENIPVVFHIEFSNEKMADTISEATGASKLLFHSCHNVTKDELEDGVTYLELMRQNAENLKEALA